MRAVPDGALDNDGKSMGLVAEWLSFADVSFLPMTKDKGPVIKFLLLNGYDGSRSTERLLVRRRRFRERLLLGMLVDG